MSTNLIYRNRPPHGNPIGQTNLKTFLAIEIWGTNSPPWNDWKRLNRTHLPYLRGLKDGGIDGARKLIELIEKFDEIEICISE